MRFAARAAVLAASLGVAACAAHKTNSTTNTTSTGEDIGRTAGVSLGTIVALRPVAVQARTTGAGARGGNDVRGTILGAIGGAVVGNAVENRASRGPAVEFIIREETGQTVSVVQSNEENFQPGEPIVLTRGARTRLARGAPPPPPGT